MNDPPGLPSALGIEAVEWFAQEGGGENLTVRVTGRWRRRRPASTAQPTLVVEVHGYRHRYPAMPEPPSLTGTAPGTWRMTFSVPAWIAPHLHDRASLQFGGVVIPLPATVTHAPKAGPERELHLHIEAARRRAREAERRADELAQRIRALEAELAEAQREPARLAEQLAGQERARRVAEQRAYAERRLREDVQDELAEQMRELADAEGPRQELAAAVARIRELEAELGSLRRALDEADQLAAAARGRLQRRQVETHMTSRIRGELAVAMRTPPAPGEAGAVPVLETRGLGLERALVAARAGVPATADVVQDEDSAHAEPSAELAATLGALRDELHGLREIAERERAGHAAALAQVANLERELNESATRSLRAYEAIDELRDQLEEVRRVAAGLSGVAGEPSPSPPATGPVDAARLEAALSRLRESAPTPEVVPAAVTATRPWLVTVLRRMLERDPVAAGRLVLALLPAQRLVARRPVAYDLVLAEDGCVLVTVAGEHWSVERADAPRPADAVQFSVATDLAGLARFVATGKARGRLRRARARVAGDRDAARVLGDLVRVPLSVTQLVRAGVVLDPLSALSMVALMLELGWTKGERFVIAYQPPDGDAPAASLVVQDGAPVAAVEGPPAEPAATTIVCPPDSLLLVLDGGSVPDAQIGPDMRPLTLLQGWMKRAQSG